jgi:hypothetical protein
MRGDREAPEEPRTGSRHDKTFDNEWIFEAFGDHPTFFTKRMFGGLAAYLFGRQMLVLAEPTKTGRWQWHGVLVCTHHEHQPSICADFRALAPHAVLRKWLFLDSRHAAFEATMEAVAARIAANDPRFGIEPAATRRKPATSSPARSRRGPRRGSARGSR